MPTNTGALSNATIGFCSGIALSDCSQIDSFFQQKKTQNYIKWFNATLANKSSWSGVTLVDNPQNDAGFRLFWNRIDQIFGGTIDLVQFVALMSIVSNEARADFRPQAEKMGRDGHPGLAYLFDAIPGLKRSYNTLKGGRTAFDCFNNPAYLAAHQNLPGATPFLRTTDEAWKGESWPAAVPTSPTDPNMGFVLEADFMKFRGRGFIQTTGRANYKGLVSFVQTYTGTNATLLDYKTRWAGKAPDDICYSSTNADWDALFQNTDLAVAAEAVRLHNATSGNYLAISKDPTILNGQSKGSLYYMGLRIGGGDAYAQLFRSRVSEVLTAIQA